MGGEFRPDCTCDRFREGKLIRIILVDKFPKKTKWVNHLFICDGFPILCYLEDGLPVDVYKCLITMVIVRKLRIGLFRNPLPFMAF